MLEKYKEELPLFYEQINKVISSGKINHAYLLETKNYDDVKTLVLDISKQLITCKANLSDVKIQKIYQQIDNGTFNDFYFIERDGAYIKKEQLLKLQDEFKNKSINNGIRLYVIYEADKLNKASANTILKFLEEPNDNIIALLVTKNRYQVLSTILSRCQLLTITDSLSSQSKKDDPIKIEVVISFLLNLSIKQKKIIGYLNNEWIALSKTKDDLF
ncbi:MAG: hypothetical protein RSE56_02995, partial [Bacilli bacterium]